IAYPITLINLSDMQQGRWKEYDVLIMPNGNYRFLGDKGQAEALRTWVESGGHLVAMENAVAQLSRLDWAIKPKKQEGEESKEPYAALKRYEERERDFIPEMTPGSIYRVELDNTHPLGFGYPSYYYTLKQDANIYDFIRDGGWNVGVIKKDRQVAGFVGSRLRERLQDGLLFGVQEIGQGTITHLGDNLLFRSFWENGKLMFSNAVFLVGD
ncbi:MAG TPA: zinc carboxypeptidase, partial [Flavisolibacter sp.]|nr:zinc carboxypeptidase [Flavisolibacter sp.]